MRQPNCDGRGPRRETPPLPRPKTIWNEEPWPLARRRGVQGTSDFFPPGPGLVVLRTVGTFRHRHTHTHKQTHTHTDTQTYQCLAYGVSLLSCTAIRTLDNSLGGRNGTFRRKHQHKNVHLDSRLGDYRKWQRKCTGSLCYTTAVNLGVGWRHQVAFNSKRPCGHPECTDDPEHDRDGVEQQ